MKRNIADIYIWFWRLTVHRRLSRWWVKKVSNFSFEQRFRAIDWGYGRQSRAAWMNDLDFAPPPEKTSKKKTKKKK